MGGPRVFSADIAAGAGMGALLGLMLGLSQSPVVATFVGAVAAILVTLLGLTDRGSARKQPEAAGEEGSTPSPGEAPGLQRSLALGRNLKVASFAFVCVAMTLGALWARTHDWLGFSLAERLARAQGAWLSAGYSPEDVQRFVAFEELGSLPPGALGTPLKGDGAPTAGEPGASLGLASTGALFSTEELRDSCIHLNHDFGRSKAALNAFKQQGGAWKRLAERAEERWARASAPDEPAQVETLHLLRDLLCDKAS